MDELSAENVEEFLRRFEHLDGGVIQRIEIKEEVVELDLTAFEIERHGWVTLRLQLGGLSEFCVREGVKESGVQLDVHLEAVWLDGRVFVILDPLQARDFTQPQWTIEQVRRSRWYAGGHSLSWKLPFDDDRVSA